MAHVGSRRRRPLGGFETFMWHAAKMGCGVIYAIADVPTLAAAARRPGVGAGGAGLGGREGDSHALEAPDAPELLRLAALHCARRHPNLRARIGTDKASGEPHLEVLAFESFVALCPSVQLVTDRSAVACVEGLLMSTPIPRAAAPLWELVLVRHGASPPQLVMLAHHSVLDGESVVLCLRELVATVTALRRQFPDSPAALEALLASGPDPLPSQDELYATLLGGGEGDGWWSRAQFALKRLSWLLKRPTVPAPERITTDVSARQNRIFSTQVQGRDFEQLLRRCKVEGTTVTAALAAAVMLEIKALMPGPTAALKIETMVNLRGKLSKADAGLAESLHLFAAPIDMVVAVDSSVPKDQQRGDQGLWQGARAYKRDLNKAMAAGQWRHQVAAFAAFPGFVYRVLERLGVGPSQGRVKAAAVSNLGNLDDKLGASGISRLQWGISEHGIGQWAFVAASSQHGALNLTITTVDPIVSPDRARAFLAGIVGRVLAEPASAGVDAVGRLEKGDEACVTKA